MHGSVNQIECSSRIEECPGRIESHRLQQIVAMRAGIAGRLCILCIAGLYLRLTAGPATFAVVSHIAWN